MDKMEEEMALGLLIDASEKYGLAWLRRIHVRFARAALHRKEGEPK